MNVGIVGAGIFGLAAAIELRARGYAVVVVEQGQIPYERASSTDVSKTIRRAYGNNATYVELAERAAPRWRAWHERLGRGFYFQIGQLQIERNFHAGQGVRESYEFFRRRGGDGSTLLSVAEARQRFPQFAYDDGDTCVFDPWAGYIASGRAVLDLARLAREEGVTIREVTPARQVIETGDRAEIVLDGETLQFDRVVVAAGVWITRLMPSIGRALRPTFQQMAFFEPVDRDRFAPGPLPAWGVDVETEGWYGHPLQAEGWVKVSNDLLGKVVDADAPRVATPEFLEAAHEFVARRMPELARGRLVGTRACLYENTPDRHFVIDWAPGCQRILVAGGGSGHGFKFGGSIGDVIADALEDRNNPLGNLFRLGNRFKVVP
jgi:glycine/D-amino acid oxidase-like deaminating enzyme